MTFCNFCKVAGMVMACGLGLFGAERRVYVARHCQAGGTDLKPIVDDGGITRLGVEQSHYLGANLKKLGFAGPIFASPYYRTVATACFAAEECGAKVYPDARVQERVARKGGNLKKGGATLEKLRELFPKQIADDAKLDFPWLLTEIEDYSGSQQARLEKALDEFLKEFPDTDIMIVTHAGAVAALNRILAGRAGTKPTGTTWNCALYCYSLDDKGAWHFVKYGYDFMPREAVTSNLKSTLLKPNADVKSGQDYKIENAPLGKDNTK